MARTSIMTDSSSGLTPEEAGALGIALIPMHIEIDGQTYREGIDLSLPEIYQLLGNGSQLPNVSPPSAREFRDLFRQLAQDSEEIIAIHGSARLSPTINVARQAAQTFMGRSRVTVVDSRLIATPMAWLATAASEAAAAGVDTSEIVRLLRAMIAHMYVAFFVESTERLRERELVPRAAVGAAASRPLLMIEEGEIMPLERSRSRGRAVDRLFEFVSEFPRLEQLTILQGRPLPEALELATMISEEMPEQPVETRTYPASVAIHVGTQALGVAVYEGLA